MNWAGLQDSSLQCRLLNHRTRELSTCPGQRSRANNNNLYIPSTEEYAWLSVTLLATEPGVCFSIQGGGSMKRALMNVSGFCLTWAIWLWLAGRQLETRTSLAVAV